MKQGISDDFLSRESEEENDPSGLFAVGTNNPKFSVTCGNSFISQSHKRYSSV